METKKINKSTTGFLTITLIIMMTIIPQAAATLKLDNIQFDPAIIAAGDEVDIVIQYQSTITATEEDKINDPEYTYKIKIEADDDLTRKYVTIQDEQGDAVSGTIYAGEKYNKRFRVKVEQNAVAGNYEFKLSGRWYKNGIAESAENYVRFMMPVKKEGIILGLASVTTTPAEVRPGDDYVKITANIENSGTKDAKAIEVNLELPEEIESSYTDKNRRWVGMVKAGTKEEATFFVDIDEKANPETYDIKYKLNYMDTDNNKYQTTQIIPFQIMERPYIEVTGFEGKGTAGSKIKLKVTLKNTGTESAEAVDVRIIKQSAQPFEMDVRSEYIGELKPGEEGTAIFTININKEAQIKEYPIKLLVRSKGDSDQGDDNIYTYSRRARIEITGEATNPLKTIGIIATIIVGILIIISISRKTKEKR